MFDLAETLRSGLEMARAQLRDAQRSVVRANSGDVHGRSADAAMAQTAKAAIFTEALLAAVRARLAEVKAVTK